jgi:hypothetical protein
MSSLATITSQNDVWTPIRKIRPQSSRSLAFLVQSEETTVSAESASSCSIRPTTGEWPLARRRDRSQSVSAYGPTKYNAPTTQYAILDMKEYSTRSNQRVKNEEDEKEEKEEPIVPAPNRRSSVFGSYLYLYLTNRTETRVFLYAKVPPLC